MIGTVLLAVAVSHAPVVVSVSPSFPCRYSVDAAPVAEEALASALRPRRASTPRATLRYDLQTPWRCMGAAMTALAKARFRRVAYDPLSPRGAGRP